MTQEIRREGLMAKVQMRPGQNVTVTIEMSGNLHVKQAFQTIEDARNGICGLAREICYNAKQTGEKLQERNAAVLFSFMREVRP